MDKQKAIEYLLDLKEKTGLSRDKLIEVYNVFKSNPDLEAYGVVHKGEIIKIENNLAWMAVNCSDIKNMYKTDKVIEKVDEQTQLVNSLLRKENIRKTNKLNHERKAFNKQLKELSELEDLNKELIEILKELKPLTIKDLCQKRIKTDNSDILLVQLSDLHINELTNEFRETNFGIETASKRLQKFANEIKKEIKNRKIDKVVLFMTGDICNSDSILSKQANNSSNKATSIIMAFKLLKQFICDIYLECQNIYIGAVCGNEGRLQGTDIFFTDENLVTNSPDYIVYNMLSEIFEDFEDIKFLDGRNAEQVVNINGQNILFTHGVAYQKGEVNKSVMQTIARYSDKGVNIRFCVFGHLHSAFLSDFFMRSSSLVGNNSYASTMLNLNSRASQNIAIISHDGTIIPMVIDLQNIDTYNGYDIQKEVEKFGLREITSKIDDDTVHYV